MKNKRLASIILIVTCILLIPLIAMQFTDEVNWALSDFIIAGIIMLGTGLMIDFTIRKVPKVKHRIVICLTILAFVFLLWMELAVGIFGLPFGGT